MDAECRQRELCVDTPCRDGYTSKIMTSMLTNTANPKAAALLLFLVRNNLQERRVFTNNYILQESSDTR